MLLSWEYLLWHLFGLCWDLLLVCNFGEVHFTAVIMSDFFFYLVSLRLFVVILCRKSCLPAALSAESDRGQRKALQLLESKLPTNQPRLIFW
jgi:hypothetical protein